LKREKGNMSVRELFNEQLRNAEVIPDAAFEKRLMRKLSGKEFVRFIPSKFNIFYLVGLIALGVTAGLIFSSNQQNDINIPLSTISDTVFINNPEVVSIASPEIAVSIAKESQKNELMNRKSGNLTIDTEVNTDYQGNSDINKGSVTGNSNNLTNNAENAENAENMSLPGKKTANILNPLAGFEMSPAMGCLPVKIKFFNKSVNYDSCIWTFGDGGTSHDIDPEWIFDEEGVYKIELTVINKAGLASVSVNSLIVYPRPQARFEISSENVIIPDDEVRFMNYSSNAVSYKWDFGDGNSSEDYEPVYRYNNNGKYNVQLIVKSEFGCADTLVVENAFAGSAYSITFPNAFIPNSGGPSGGYYSLKSDEDAQVFHPVSSGVSEYQLRIFSKRGILIFESNDINIGWDGYYKSQLSEPGVYIWKVRGKFNNGEPFVKMGDVLILKD